MKDADKLREAARKLRAIAPELTDPARQITRSYPADRDWKGPAADEFNTELGTAIKALTTLTGDIEDYAIRLDTKAKELDAKAKRPDTTNWTK